MRPFTAAAAALVCLTLAASPIAAEPMKPGERQRLLAHLEMTEGWLTSEVEGLSDAQLKFRMTPESWSIMDVVEHLAVAEPQYWTQLLDSLKGPASPGKVEATESSESDDVSSARNHQTSR